jgi:hypothetical protein
VVEGIQLRDGYVAGVRPSDQFEADDEMDDAGQRDA